MAVTLLSFQAVLGPIAAEASDDKAASIRAVIDKIRLHGEDAVYVAEVASSLGLSQTHKAVLVKHIEVRFSDDHRRFIAVTESDEIVLTYRRRPGAYSLVIRVLARDYCRWRHCYGGNPIFLGRIDANAEYSSRAGTRYGATILARAF